MMSADAISRKNPFFSRFLMRKTFYLLKHGCWPFIYKRMILSTSLPSWFKKGQNYWSQKWWAFAIVQNCLFRKNSSWPKRLIIFNWIWRTYPVSEIMSFSCLLVTVVGELTMLARFVLIKIRNLISLNLSSNCQHCNFCKQSVP